MMNNLVYNCYFLNYLYVHIWIINFCSGKFSTIPNKYANVFAKKYNTTLATIEFPIDSLKRKNDL